MNINPDPTESALDYASDLTVQLKKGLLTQCVLLTADDPIYASEILAKLEKAQLDIVEGTIYPLLSRLAQSGLLIHQWQESSQGPPRKYYQITDYGRSVRAHLAASIHNLDNVIKNLERNNNQ